MAKQTWSVLFGVGTWNSANCQVFWRSLLCHVQSSRLRHYLLWLWSNIAPTIFKGADGPFNDVQLLTQSRLRAPVLVVLTCLARLYVRWYPVAREIAGRVAICKWSRCRVSEQNATGGKERQTMLTPSPVVIPFATRTNRGTPCFYCFLNNTIIWWVNTGIYCYPDLSGAKQDSSLTRP